MAAAAPKPSLGNPAVFPEWYCVGLFSSKLTNPIITVPCAVLTGRLQTAWSLCKTQKAPVDWAHLSKLPSMESWLRGDCSALSLSGMEKTWIQSPHQGNSSLENHSTRRCAKFTYLNHFLAVRFHHGPVSQLYDSLCLEWIYTNFPLCIFLCCCMASKC